MKGHSQRGKSNARALRTSQTDAEQKLWHLLRSRNLAQTKFRRQHPVGPYVVDFICLNEKLVVEIDGGQHQQQQIYDMRRTVFLEQAGYRVIRFWNDDVLTKTDSVLQVIYDALGDPSPQPSPRSR